MKETDQKEYTKPDFSALSIKDLLEARETFHLFLSNLDNVVGTAIGKYLIRVDDPDAKDAKKEIERNKGKERTLANSIVTKWSWPCIIVFVDQWLPFEELRKKPERAIPSCLHLQDGRVVPLCIVKTEREEEIAPPLDNFSLPNQLMGGGYPIFTDVQGQEHVGTLGCLVTDGDRVYGLTNRHVVGERFDNQPGRRVFSFVSGKSEQQEIGIGSYKQVGKRSLKDVYPGWPGSYSYLVIDAGLIELEDITEWTAQVYGIGEIAEPLDLNIGNINLNILGCPVRSFGGASGEMRGEIKALFYRYKSMGGFDYVADLLIGPRGEHEALMTREGDSGTVWFFDSELQKELENEGTPQETGERARRFTPIALQWGGQKLMSGKLEEKLGFALATCLSTVCRELDVDIVRGWNIGYGETWGKLGHYKIAAKACEIVKNEKLKILMMANLKNISFNDQIIESGNIPRFGKDQFIPLADVPDLAWRWKHDGNNHFADMDQEGQDEFEGKTLLDLMENPVNVNIDFWNKFYSSIKVEKRGALPFRIWQIYNEMVKALKMKDVARFVCAAGILGHYAADSSEPLHVSQYHHGHPEKPEENGVHAAYETRMLDACAAEIVFGVNQQVEKIKFDYKIQDGHSAAVAAIKIMRKVLKILPPLIIVEAYNESAHVVKKMYKSAIKKYKIDEKTAICMAEGCRLLAALWDSAWKIGNGDAIPKNRLVEVDNTELKKLYMDKEFLRSYNLLKPEFAAALKT